MTTTACRQRTAARVLRSVSANLGSSSPGVAVCLIVAAVATLVGSVVPIVGAPVIAIVLGFATRVAVRGVGNRTTPGVDVCKKSVLQLAVVVLGSQLSLSQIEHVGIGSLPVMLGTMGVCFVVTYLVGRQLGIDRDLRVLIGVGTGICGASAI